MKRSHWFTSRFEAIHAIIIAVVALSTAFAVWRTNVVGSIAADENRNGLIANRFLIDWNRQYREPWLDREKPQS